MFKQIDLKDLFKIIYYMRHFHPKSDLVPKESGFPSCVSILTVFNEPVPEGVIVFFEILGLAPLTLQFSKNEKLKNHSQPDTETPIRLSLVQLFIGSNEGQLKDLLRGIDIGEPMRGISE